MKTFLTKLSALALVLTMGLASCTEEDPIGPGGSNNVTELSANSASSTSINARWKGGSATDTLVATAAGVEVSRTAVVTTEGVYSMATIGGLTYGTEYTLTVRNADGVSGSLVWAPARRWPSEAGGGSTVRLYSTAAPASVGPSGLIIGDNTITATSTETADSMDIDMVLGWNDDANMPVSLLSPGVLGSGVFNGKNTKFAKPYLINGGLDRDYYTGPVQGLFAGTSAFPVYTAIDVEVLTGTDVNHSLVVPFLTQNDNHYGRIEIVPQSNGQLFGTTVVGGKQYEFVDVRVSYQTAAGSGYVGRPQARVRQERITAPSPYIKN